MRLCQLPLIFLNPLQYTQIFMIKTLLYWFVIMIFPNGWQGYRNAELLMHWKNIICHLSYILYYLYSWICSYLETVQASGCHPLDSQMIGGNIFYERNSSWGTTKRQRRSGPRENSQTSRHQLFNIHQKKPPGPSRVMWLRLDLTRSWIFPRIWGRNSCTWGMSQRATIRSVTISFHCSVGALMHIRDSITSACTVGMSGPPQVESATSGITSDWWTKDWVRPGWLRKI